MRLPRFRVQTLMIAVAAVAVLIWGAMMGVRSFDSYRRASFFGEQESGWRQIAARDGIRPEFSAECVEYFSKLTQKYRRAMWHPWTPVAPDAHAPGYDQWVEQENRAKQSPSNPDASTHPE